MSAEWENDVRGYLRDLRLTTPVDWQRDGFGGDTGVPKRTSACLRNHRNNRILFRVLVRLGLFWGFRPPGDQPRVGTVVVNLIRLDRLVDGSSGRIQGKRIHTPEFIRDRIRLCETSGKRWFYVYVGWFWNAHPRAYRETHKLRTDSNHATLMVVDTVRREYHLWDPNGGDWSAYNELTRGVYTFSPYDAIWESSRRTNPNNRFLPGYRLVLPDAIHGHTLQNSMDRMLPRTVGRVVVKTEPDDALLSPQGMCASSVLLLLAFCLRFDVGAPADFDRIVNQYAVEQDAQSRRGFTVQLAHWHRRLYSVNSWSQMERALGLRGENRHTPESTYVVERTEYRCGVVVDAETGDVCPERPCDGSILCRGHRDRWFGGTARPTVVAGGTARLACDDPVPWDASVGSFPLYRPAESDYIDVELDVHIRDTEENIREFEHIERLRRVAEETRGDLIALGVPAERATVPILRDGRPIVPLAPHLGPTRGTQAERVERIRRWTRQRQRENVDRKRERDEADG